MLFALLQEVKRFGGPLMISCTPVFGGAGVANQITELKRGTEVGGWVGWVLVWFQAAPRLWSSA